MKSMEPLDNILLAIFAFSFVVPTIVQSFGLNIRLAWLPILFYAFWILGIAYFKPSYFLADYPERALIERIRGWTYVFSLAITLLGNWFLLAIIPRTLSNFFTGILLVAILLLIL